MLLTIEHRNAEPVRVPVILSPRTVGRFFGLPTIFEPWNEAVVAQPERAKALIDEMSWRVNNLLPIEGELAMAFPNSAINPIVENRQRLAVLQTRLTGMAGGGGLRKEYIPLFGRRIEIGQVVEFFSEPTF